MFLIENRNLKIRYACHLLFSLLIYSLLLIKELNTMKKSFINLFLAGMLSSISVFAEEASTAASPETVALVKKISHDQLSVLKTFQGPENLQGLVLQPTNGQPVIMYADKKGEYLVYGAIFDKEGKNLSEKDNDTYVKPYVSELLLNNLAEASMVKEGSDLAPYKVMVFADPNCSACHYAYNVMKPFIEKGELQVSWIFVYFVQADSEGKAAAIMTAKDPAKAMAENEAGFDIQKEEGGIPALKEIPNAVSDKLKGNMDLMHRAGITGTPTILFWNKDQGLEVLTGFPSDFGAFLKEKSPNVKEIH